MTNDQPTEQSVPLQDIQPGQRDLLHPEDMRLDFENPRFAAHGAEARGELEGIQQLLDYADLRELIETIAANGFINFEPLIVLRRSDHYLVLEGNRRLAAVKLLIHEDWAEELNLALPPMSPEARSSLETIEVQAVASRDDARQFIGFKHINGPHKWDSFAKAKFAANWYRQERDNGVTLRDISRRLGDRHDTIKRLVQGIFVLEQAQKEGLFEPDDRFGSRPFAFSHLYTALTRSGYRRFLGMPEKWRDADPLPDPISPQHLPRLSQVLLWLYGSRSNDEPPVVASQNPHIKQLGEVLEHEVAVHRLQIEKSLAVAYGEIMTPSRKFTEAMIKALQAAESAQQNVYDFDSDDHSLLQISFRLWKVSDSIYRQVKRGFEESGSSE